MPEFTFNVEAEGLTAPRVDDLTDLYDVLVEDEHVLGPALAGDLAEGTIDVILTIEALTEAEARRQATASLARALIATGRASSVARVAEVVSA